MRAPPFLPALVSTGAASLRRLLATWRIRVGQSALTFTPVDGAAAGRGADGREPWDGFDERRAFALLEAQCARGARVPGTEAHAWTERLIVDSLARYADAVAVQRWRQRVARGPGAGRTFAMTNVLARFEGVGGASAGPADLMLSTHWDTRPVADHDPDPARRAEPVIGASDGASGVAVLLELARGLAARRPRATTILAFWDGEDLGEYYYGSRLFARTAGRRALARWRARCGVVVDMIGGERLRCTTELHSVRVAPALWAHVHRSASAVGVADHFHGPPRRVNDDHVFLGRAGIPTVLLIDFGYPYWHTTGDVPARCSPASLGAVGRVLEHLVTTELPPSPTAPALGARSR